MYGCTAIRYLYLLYAKDLRASQGLYNKNLEDLCTTEKNDTDQYKVENGNTVIDP